MAIETLTFFDMSQFNTSNWSAVMSIDGSSWNVGTDWINLNSSATFQTVTLNDDDASFGDDDTSQTLSGAHTLGGATFPDGTMIEDEYLLTLEDSLGNQYQIAGVSLGGDGFNFRGFAFVGDPPPLNENLTIVAAQDYGEILYSPVCFTRGTTILAEQGPTAVESLKQGDRIWTQDHGFQPLRLIARSHFEFGPGSHPHKPIMISRGALGAGLPERDLVVSPQHRMLVEGGTGAVLVPAKALTGLPGIRSMNGRRAIEYFHLVLERHEIVLANGALTETLLPGPMALSGFDPRIRARVLAAMAPESAQHPARPLLSVREGRALAETLRAAALG